MTTTPIQTLIFHLHNGSTATVNVSKKYEEVVANYATQLGQTNRDQLLVISDAIGTTLIPRKAILYLEIDGDMVIDIEKIQNQTQKILIYLTNSTTISVSIDSNYDSAVHNYRSKLEMTRDQAFKYETPTGAIIVPRLSISHIQIINQSQDEEDDEE